MPPTKTALSYLRVSTERQTQGEGAEGYSIPAQRRACQRKATDLDAAIVQEFVDAGESARSADRPELQNMLRRLEAGDVDYVIVHKLDRLARSRADDVTIALTIRQAGAELVSCSENIDNSPAGSLVHGIMASIAEFYSKNLSAEAKKGLHEKARRGGTPGKAPIGYLNIISRNDGREHRTVEPDPERGELVSFAFEAYATGLYTLTQLTELLEDKGLNTRPTPKFPSKPLSRTQVHRMLKHPYYMGIVRYGGAEYDGTHEPLTDPATWQKVQDVLSLNRQGKERSQRHQHYLKGSLFCAYCGDRMTLTNSRGKTGDIYPYFYCLGRNKNRTECVQPYVPVALIEQAVETYYRDHFKLDGEQLGHIHDTVTDHINRKLRLTERELARQRARLKSLRSERQALLRAHMAGSIPPEMHDDEQRRLNQDEQKAQRVIRSCEIHYTDVRRALDIAISMLNDPYGRAIVKSCG